MTFCPITGIETTEEALAEARWLSPKVIAYIQEQNPNWSPEQGACPSYIQQILLEILLSEGDTAFHESVQAQFPLDAEAAFGAIPTPLRLHADARYTGKGITIAMIDSDFYPHPDLVKPVNRIRAYVEVTQEAAVEKVFSEDELPTWEGADDGRSEQWHGMMTATATAGNGYLSHGLYRGLASDAQVILIKTYDGGISNQAIIRALNWVTENAEQHSIRVVNMSIGSDYRELSPKNPIDKAIAKLNDKGITIVAAAGNDGQRRLVPPASSPFAMTVGGIDDENDFDDETIQLWHSNYGQSTAGGIKPELVAPSIWIVAPVLPHTDISEEAQTLFDNRGNDDTEDRIHQLKLVTPYYQHVDGTSFAAPLVTSTIACMLEANPNLQPALIRDLLIQTAQHISDVSQARQGHGVLQAGLAVASAMHEEHQFEPFTSPIISDETIQFLLHDHQIKTVSVLGSWNGWQAPLEAQEVEDGLWMATLESIPSQDIQYKFLLDNQHWLDDPLNPHKVHDAFGGLNSFIKQKK